MHDSGATRNSVAEETLRQIKADPEQKGAVVDEYVLKEPLYCGSVARDATG